MGCWGMRVKALSLGTAGREQRQAAPTCGCLHISRHSAPEPRSSHALGIARSSEHTRTCVCGCCRMGSTTHLCVYTAQCFRLLQALSAMLSCCGPLAMPKTSSLRLPLLEEQPQTTCRALLSHCPTSCSPGKPSLAGSSGSAQPDLLACTPGAGKQRAGHEHQPEAPASWCSALGEHWGAGKALTI